MSAAARPAAALVRVTRQAGPRDLRLHVPAGSVEAGEIAGRHRTLCRERGQLTVQPADVGLSRFPAAAGSGDGVDGGLLGP